MEHAALRIYKFVYKETAEWGGEHSEVQCNFRFPMLWFSLKQQEEYVCLFLSCAWYITNGPVCLELMVLLIKHTSPSALFW